jgi:hypothetical protein
MKARQLLLGQPIQYIIYSFQVLFVSALLYFIIISPNIHPSTKPLHLTPRLSAYNYAMFFFFGGNHLLVIVVYNTLCLVLLALSSNKSPDGATATRDTPAQK